MPSKDPKKTIYDHSIPEPTSGCWIWIGACLKDGRGNITREINGKKKSIRASRFSYEAFVGPIPTGMLICHKCDTPSCVNPQHLYCGTSKDNYWDSRNKNRHYVRNRSNHSLNKLSDEDIKYIKDNHATESTSSLANRFGVAFTTISNIRKRFNLSPSIKVVRQNLGVCTRGHSLVHPNLYSRGRGRYTCKTCHIMRSRKYREQKS